MHSLKARSRRPGQRLDKLEDRRQDNRQERGEIRTEAGALQILSEEPTSIKDRLHKDTRSSG